jgi:hypothetical protein
MYYYAGWCTLLSGNAVATASPHYRRGGNCQQVTPGGVGESQLHIPYAIHAEYQHRRWFTCALPAPGFHSCHHNNACTERTVSVVEKSPKGFGAQTALKTHRQGLTVARAIAERSHFAKHAGHPGALWPSALFGNYLLSFLAGVGPPMNLLVTVYINCTI